MKIRKPKSFAAAITKIRAALSDADCAKLVGRSESLVRKWADPDHPSLPNIQQSLALDAGYSRAGHGEPPILDVYEELLADEIRENHRSAADILLSALSVQGIVGDLSEAIRSTVAESQSGGIEITPRDRALILELLQRLDDTAELIEDAVEGTD